MKSAKFLMMILTLSILSVGGCGGGGGGGNGNGNPGGQAEVSYNPVIDPANFVVVINNSYLPLLPGTTYLYISTAPIALARTSPSPSPTISKRFSA